MKLSIIIPTHQDNAELEATIRSILLNSPEDVLEIVVVDDASNPAPIALSRWQCLRFVRNAQRIGCGPSRYVGACAAKGEWLLFVDSHMRFTPGWYEAWAAAAGSNGTQTLFCGSCLALDDKNMDVTKARPYFGATWRFYGHDKDPHKQVFECIWQPEQPGDSYEIPAVMGACYFIRRDWFVYLQALKNLCNWGADEQELSLKAWLAGGKIVFLKNVRIGHKFRAGKLNKIQPSDPLRNKLFVMRTCLPPELASRLQKKMHRDGHLTAALRRLFDDAYLVEAQRAYNATIFTRDFQWYLNRFNLQFPNE